MAFSASTFSTGEIVTAAKMNTIRDSLNYLKGLDGGTVVIETALSAGAGNVVNTLSSGGIVAASSSSGTNAVVTSQNDASVQSRMYTARSGIGGGFAGVTFFENSGNNNMVFTSTGNYGLGLNNPSAKLGVAGNLAVGASYGSGSAPANGAAIQGSVGVGTASPGGALGVAGGASFGASYAATAPPSNGTIIQGNVGIGTSSPQGKLHGHDGMGGFLYWTGSGIGAGAVTIIPDATGDVTTVLSGFLIVRASSGTTNLKTLSGVDLLTPSSTVIIQDDGGGNRCALTCSAGGAVTIARNAGALTYTAVAWLFWY